MDRKFGYLIVLGLLIGAVFGMGVGTANGNTLFGIGLGTLGGVFMGWFAAATVLDKQDNVVILGRGSQAILQDMPNVFHVRVVAPLDVRVRRIQTEDKRLSTQKAHDWAVAQDQKTAQYLKRFFGIRWDDPLLYHLVINTDRLKPQSAAEFIVQAVTHLEPAPTLQGQAEVH